MDLSRFLAEGYAQVKAAHPAEGRRRWRLRVAEQFWALSPQEKQFYAASAAVPADAAEDADYSNDDDPLDSASVDAPGLAIIVRTDFTNESAWQEFCSKLRDAESEFSASPDDDPMDGEGPGAAGSSTGAIDKGDEGDDENDDVEVDDSGTAAIFHVVNPESTSDREVLVGISNLRALRLLNDVDIRPAPVPPAGTKRIKPPNRLVDYDGWQEVYVGKMVWVYDGKSNTDQCVRLVSQQSASMYGTATADSWRARVSHICELQVNIASGAMTIDFGGMDRWDYTERVRNMAEAEQPLA